MEFYRNVSRKQYSGGKAPANMAVYEEQARREKAEREEQSRIALESAQRDAKAARDAARDAAASKVILEAKKKRIAMELAQFVPLQIMNEFFSRVVVNALPHDKEYIEGCKESITVVNRVWLHSLGGFNYLKEQATKTNSNLLKSLCKVIKENTDKILKARLVELQNARTENEVNGVLAKTMTPDEADKLNKDINDLGPEEISELVHNKVLDVVKDETKRQSEDTAFRAELAMKATEYEEQDNEKLNEHPANGNEETDQTDTHEDEEVEAESESYKLAKFLLDPTIIHEHSLFYSMMNSVYYERINALKENVEVPAAAPQMVQPKTARVLTSPLNLNMFDVYLNDYQDDLKFVDSLRIANKTPMAGSETKIDADDVLAEALLQYTMLEAAMTIKLITPTYDEVRKVAEYNMSFRK